MEKVDVLSCPCDVDESIVSEDMNLCESFQDMTLCGRVFTDDSGLDLTVTRVTIAEVSAYFKRERERKKKIYLWTNTGYIQDHKIFSMKTYRVPFHQQLLVQYMVEEQLQPGFIVPREPSDPPWAFLVIIRNKSEIGDI
ncbi:hypothetical protein PR048_002482 [Dryococelus australis]|uniref:Uncharacterized protein n=1 Tax=Dryococelus australis TaxID=614101 RepID=A0ABQ9IKB2_9NEOP|nr:hypothetical protein PR048_002482 [Dryococelus australis]